MFKRKVIEEKQLVRIDTDEKGVFTSINPYFARDLAIQVSVKSIEEITVNHKRLDEARLLGDVLKDADLKKRHKKKLVKDCLKSWEKEYQAEITAQKKVMQAKIKKLKKRRIRPIGNLFIGFSSLVAILSFSISNQLNFLIKLPMVGKIFKSFYSRMGPAGLNRSLVLLTYVALFTALYLIIIKIYFNETSQVGGNADGFINDTYRTLQRKMKKQHKAIKSHLHKYRKSKFYKKHYPIKRILDPQSVFLKIEQYSHYVNEKLARFSNYYLILLLVGFLLKLTVIGWVLYIGYAYMTL